MLRLVLATSHPEPLEAFTNALSADPEVHLEQVASGAAALEAVRAATPHLVIVDAHLPDIPTLELVRNLLMANAMVNTAVISPMPDEEFHEASEGLGILYRLPLKPGSAEATALVDKLRKIQGLVG